MSKKNKNFDSDKYLRKQDEKGRENFNIAYNMLMASTGTSDVLKGKMSPRSKLLALGTTLALITTGAVAYNEVTKKSVAPNQPPTVIWNNITTEVPVNVTTYIDRWNNNTVNNTIFNNITSPVYTKVPALISGPASLMKVLTKLNASERNQAFANLTSMYPELKLSNGTPVTDTPTALSSLLDCNEENDYLNGVIVYTVPEQNDTIPGMNGSFAIKVKNGTVEKNVTTELDNILAKKIYDLAFSTKDDPVEWVGSGQTPSYLASITDLVQLRHEISSLKGNFTNSYIDASNPADSDKMNALYSAIPALEDLANKTNIGNVSAFEWIDTPDDAPGTPNGGGSVIIEYNSTGGIVGMIALDKNETKIYNDILLASGTRSSGVKNLNIISDSGKSYQEVRGKREKTTQNKSEHDARMDKIYAKISVKEMAKDGMHKVYCNRDLLVGYDDNGKLKEVRHIRSGKTYHLNDMVE